MSRLQPSGSDHYGWIVLKVDKPNQTPAGCDKQATSWQPKSCLCTLHNLDLLFEIYAELDSIFCSCLFIWGPHLLKIKRLSNWASFQVEIIGESTKTGSFLFDRYSSCLDPNPGSESLHVSSGRYQSGQNWAGFCRLWSSSVHIKYNPEIF